MLRLESNYDPTKFIVEAEILLELLKTLRQKGHSHAYLMQFSLSLHF